MSYTPTTWETGDIITAEKLNNMESGIEAASGGILVLHEGSNTALDKTYEEIETAFNAGTLILVDTSESVAPFKEGYSSRGIVLAMGQGQYGYEVAVAKPYTHNDSGIALTNYLAQTKSSYPAWD